MARANIRDGVSLPFPWIHGLTRRQQHEIWSDFQALDRSGTGTRWATLVIAASDSTKKSRDKADYVCNGSNDSAKIQAAVDDLKDRGTPGRIVFLEGTYTLTESIDLDCNEYQELVLQGMSSGWAGDTTIYGASKIIGPGSGDPAIMLSGAGAASNDQPTYGFLNLSIEGNGDNAIELQHNHYAKIVVDHCALRGNAGIATSVNTLASNLIEASITNSRIVGTGNYAIILASCKKVTIANNFLVGATNGGICLNQAGGDATDSIITGNNITGSGTSGVFCDWDNSVNGSRISILSNKINGTFTYGVNFSRVDDGMIGDNHILRCTTGIYLGSTCNRTQIIGNGIIGGTNGVALNAAAAQTSIVANSVRNLSGTALSISASATNTREIGNDWGGFTITDSAPDTVHDSPGSDSDTVALTRARGNGGTSYERHRINFIEGANVDISVADDAVDDEIDVTIAATDSSATAAAAKGDILVGIAAGTVSRLPVDRDGQILISDSGTATGLKWGPKLTVSKDAPTNPKPGDIWMDLP